MDPDGGVDDEREADAERFDEAIDEEREEPPLSAWGEISEFAGALIALLLLAIAVLVVYVAGGVFFALVAWAAPAVAAVAVAIVLARYLGRTK